jgi:hypothetical protein
MVNIIVILVKGNWSAFVLCCLMIIRRLIRICSTVEVSAIGLESKSKISS